MAVNQEINPDVAPGVRVRVIEGDYISGAFYTLDRKLIGKEGVVEFVDRSYTVYQPDAGITFDDGTSAQIEMQNLLVIAHIVEAPVELPVDLIAAAKVATPRVNYLYVVEDEDGVYGKTFDRDHAREIKASYGGKKAGVIITAYAAVKEIR